MTKQDFLAELREALCGLPQEDLEERVAFYAEQIDDRIEEGLSEADAVAAIGSVSDIVLQVVDEYPIRKLVKQTIKPRHRLRAWEIVLLALGSPIWLSLLIAAFAVVLSLYVVLWSVIVSLWAVFASLVGGAVGGILGGVLFACIGYVLSGLAVCGAALVCGGLSIFAFFGCKGATKGAVRLTKWLGIGMKRCFVRKGAAQ